MSPKTENDNVITWSKLMQNFGLPFVLAIIAYATLYIENKYTKEEIVAIKEQVRVLTEAKHEANGKYLVIVEQLKAANEKLDNLKKTTDDHINGSHK